MQNENIAKVFDEIADMLEVGEDANFFRIRAYRNAARAIRDYPAPVSELDAKGLGDIPGIGADLAGKIETLLKTGDLPIHRELRAKVPAGLMELLRVSGLGPKRVRLLSAELKIRDAADLKRAAEAGALRTVRGFGEKLQAHILQSLSRREAAGDKRLQYAEAARIAAELMAWLSKPAVAERIEIAGSFRRKRDTIGDLDVLALSSHPERVVERFVSFARVKNTLGQGDTKASVVLDDGLQIDLRIVPSASYGAALVYFTGSKAHCVHLRRIAQGRGLMLNEYGLYRDEKIVAAKTEQAVYRALGIEWITPELREDRGEIEAATSGELPALLQRSDLRGDLHTHSTYTDGRASIEQMARAARAAGLEYFAVTDHSQHLTMVHGLDPVRLREQWREIERIAARLRGVKMLRGIEVDILEDGSLDLPDDVLAELDWVVASVHFKLDQDEQEMSRRLIKAIRNPHVDVIGHPSGRLIGRREPSSFDLAEVLKVAREEGCALEVNSQPDRLDLNDTACMAARQAGVKLVVSSDSHHPRDFALLEYGVNQARRGWLQAGDVLNTRPLRSLRQRDSAHRRAAP
jgi:DNA polymerase (family X)